MIRSHALVGFALLGAVFAGGCADNHYDPKASDPQLSSYAARQALPQMSADKLPDVIFNVADNGVITISNASNMGLSQFNLWVNGQFVINVTTGLPAHTSTTIPPEKVYNNSGMNLTTIKAESINQVQIAVDGKLYNLAGPVKPLQQQ